MSVFNTSKNDNALPRFVAAQDEVYDQALGELRQGRKRSHWMWFIFPQLRGLGRSEFSLFYGIMDLEEARRYLAHPVLGARLLECANAVLGHDDLTAEAILGDIDAAKLRSSATLFAAVPGAPAIFGQIIDTFFAGRTCPVTLRRLG